LKRQLHVSLMIVQVDCRGWQEEIIPTHSRHYRPCLHASIHPHRTAWKLKQKDAAKLQIVFAIFATEVSYLVRFQTELKESITKSFKQEQTLTFRKHAAALHCSSVDLMHRLRCFLML